MDAKLYGTARHHSKLPDLPWQGGYLEDPKVQAEFKDMSSWSSVQHASVKCEPVVTQQHQDGAHLTCWDIWKRHAR